MAPPSAVKCTSRLQVSRVWGQAKALQRCSIITERSWATSLAQHQQPGWNAGRSAPPWGLCLLRGICECMYKRQKSLSLWAVMGIQEPTRNGQARTSKWTEPTWHHGLVLPTELLYGFKNHLPTQAYGETKPQLPVLLAGVRLLAFALAGTLQARSSCRTSSHAKACTVQLWCAPNPLDQ